MPGRINLIGDHTDYTGGLVLPTVVDLHTTMSGQYTNDDAWFLESTTHGTATIPLDIERADFVDPPWARYPAGVLVELRACGVALPGFSGTVSTSLPVGAGLSSSAALEVATAKIALAHDPLAREALGLADDVDLARLCQRAEHSATGVPCGLMDQLSIVCGRPGTATLIDCSSYDITYVPLPDAVTFEHRFVIARTLVGSEYSERVAQCRDIERVIGSLRQATLADIESLGNDILKRRARHVISENGRVVAFADALHDEDFASAGRLMTESHRSLTIDFETSTPVMDEAVRTALGEPGVLGARMTGGGFGGCIVIMRLR